MDGGLLLTRKLLNQGFPEVKRISKKNDMDVNKAAIEGQTNNGQNKRHMMRKNEL
jgi:hypothetical protein